MSLPYGLKHEKYRVVSPLGDRPAQVAMAYNSHPTKGAGRGLKALALVKERVPGAEIVVFGASEPAHESQPGSRTAHRLRRRSSSTGSTIAAACF